MTQNGKRAWVNGVVSQLTAFALGVTASLIATYVWERKANEEKVADLSQEVYDRLNVLGNSVAMSFDGDKGRVETAIRVWGNTESATGPSEYEGKRLPNLLIDLSRLHKTENMKKIADAALSRFDYLGFWAQLSAGEKDMSELAKGLSNAAHDISCCIQVELRDPTATACFAPSPYAPSYAYCYHDGKSVRIVGKP